MKKITFSIAERPVSLDIHDEEWNALVEIGERETVSPFDILIGIAAAICIAEVPTRVSHKITDYYRSAVSQSPERVLGEEALSCPLQKAVDAVEDES